MRVAAAAALVSALLVGGCGGADDPNADRRDAVDAYLRQVNEINAKATPALSAANTAYSGFWEAAPVAQRDAELAQAAATVAALRARVAALEPPPDARRLHARLLRLLGAQAAFAAEVRQLAAFLIRTRDPLARVDRAAAVLRRQMAREKKAKAQAVVLERYAELVDEELTPLVASTPPAPLQRWHAANIARIRATATGARRLVVTLRGRYTGLAQLAGWEFRKQMAAAPDSSQLLRSALIAFNARTKRINALAAEVAREHDRLERTLR